MENYIESFQKDNVQYIINIIGLKSLFSIYKEPNTTIDNDKSILIEADNTSVSLITFNPWHATIDCGNGFTYISDEVIILFHRLLFIILPLHDSDNKENNDSDEANCEHASKNNHCEIK